MRVFAQGNKVVQTLMEVKKDLKNKKGIKEGRKEGRKGSYEGLTDGSMIKNTWCSTRGPTVGS